MKTKIMPRNYGQNAFYVNVCDGLRFRVYKVEAFFSTVGEACVVLFYVSYRDLQKLKSFKYKHDNKTFCVADILETEVNHILSQLKTYGKCDVSFFFSRLER